ncbi:MAG TPA: BamA/TamA family outer membrane protein, partial [Ignavibacteriaceae bacterium]|nr:BamA/TamA family outer membrane protein [Ignavibacteriaceae bacterium]
MNSKLILKLFLLIIFSSILIFPQVEDSSKYITIIPGKEYEAGWFWEIFFGSHWRDIWTTPVKVEVLDLNTFAGGLTPIEKGGGMQTKSLRFKSGEGQTWKFRSINKDPSKVLPPELRQSVVEDILKDQISASNPVAALVVVPLINKVNILNAEPKLVYLPDVEKLGEFRADFGGITGFIEVHPDVDKEHEIDFEGASDVKGTYKLFDHLSEKRSEKINSTEFLKARLMDILVGDWDRHMDQWRWAKFEYDELGEWHPIPRDRDQAFAKYDGFFPSIAEYIVPQLTHFDYDYDQIKDLTWNGRYLDRRVLTELDTSVWNSMTRFVQKKITDAVIDSAVLRLPAEYFSLAGDEISRKLKSRRDKLPEISGEFFNRVNKYAEVYASNKDDYVIINRIDDKQTSVKIFKRDKSTGNPEDELYFNKIFDEEITVEVRIFLIDGDDKAVLNGEVDHSPHIRIVGGKGKDEFVDSSVVNGYFLSITPFSAAKERTYFYDSGDKSVFVEGGSTYVNTDEYPEPADDTEKYEPKHIESGHDWLPIPIVSFNSDLGFVIGGGPRLKKFGFRLYPHEYDQTFLISYATRVQRFTFDYEGNFYEPVRHGKINLKIFQTGFFATRYFGYGNETSFDKDLEKNDFYKVTQNFFRLQPTLHYKFSQTNTGRIGISFNYTNTSIANDTILTSFRYDDYGIGKLNPLGLHIGFETDKRDNLILASSGYYLDLSGSFYPEIFNVDEKFYRAGIDARVYLPIPVLSKSSLALRVGGEKVWGKYPFFAAAFVGGEENLRGYNRLRFSGDASLFGQAEARIWLTEIKLIIKGQLGLNGFGEVGRVYA